MTRMQVKITEALPGSYTRVGEIYTLTQSGPGHDWRFEAPNGSATFERDRSVRRALARGYIKQIA